MATELWALVDSDGHLVDIGGDDPFFIFPTRARADWALVQYGAESDTVCKIGEHDPRGPEPQKEGDTE